MSTDLGPVGPDPQRLRAQYESPRTIASLAEEYELSSYAIRGLLASAGATIRQPGGAGAGDRRGDTPDIKPLVRDYKSGLSIRAMVAKYKRQGYSISYGKLHSMLKDAGVEFRHGRSQTPARKRSTKGPVRAQPVARREPREPLSPSLLLPPALLLRLPEEELSLYPKIAALLGDGHTNAEIAQQLRVEVPWLQVRIGHMLVSMGVSDRAALVAAIQTALGKKRVDGHQPG